MGTAAAGGYRCRCGSDLPSFVLSIITHKDIEYYEELPEFKFLPDSGGVVETLCGYISRRNSMDFVWLDESWSGYGGRRSDSLYRLVYRRGKNVSDGTLPAASTRPHNDYDVDAEREENRLMATEEGRQRYGLRNKFVV